MARWSPGVAPLEGGDSSAVASKLTNVTQIYSNSHSVLAALRADGSVVTWGSSWSGRGDSRAVATLTRWHHLCGADLSLTGDAFAALRADGSVVTWGDC
jgi:hypothetical protein